MTTRDFKRAMREAEAALGQLSMPADASLRLRRSVILGRRHRRRVGLLVLGFAAACAAALLVARDRTASREVANLPDGFEALAHSSDLQLKMEAAPSAVRVQSGSCTLRVRGWGRVVLRAGSRLRRTSDGVELSLGAADFQVDKRAPDAGSTFVRGPQGAIEITGTRFSVVQGPDGGSVRLDEGGIRFHAPDGRVVTLAPGEALGWPLPAREPTDKPVLRIPPPVAPHVASPLPPSRGQPLRPAQLGDDDAMIDRIASRRARGEYRALAADLAAAMERERRPLTRERLSFELGTVLSFHLDDAARACAHWATHLRTFAGGRYLEEVSDARKVLGCDKGGEVE